jgi:ribosomal protein S27E
MSEHPRTTILDGNVLAGPLAELLVGGAECLTGRCGSCGARTVLAETVVTASDSGYLVTCRHCGAILATLADSAGGTVMVVEGLTGVSIRS